MKKQIYVRLNDYKKYLEKYNTNKLDDNNEIYTHGSLPKFYKEKFKINEEIFEGTPCDYKIIKEGKSFKIIKFSSKLGNNYRIDLFKEPLKTGFIGSWHIAFSDLNSDIFDEQEYHSLTNRNESIDVFSRIIWILKDLNLKEYCIGATGNPKKDKVYEYMMRFVSNWEKIETDQYPLGWAIYFKI